MLYMQERVPVPEGPGYAVHKSGRYVYIYHTAGPWRRTRKGRPRRREQCLGRMIADSSGQQYLIPNEAWYSHRGLPLPNGETAARARSREMEEAAEHLGAVPDVIHHLTAIGLIRPGDGCGGKRVRGGERAANGGP